MPGNGAQQNASNPSWPFGNDPRAIQGWLRAKDPRRDSLVLHAGHGVYTFPAHHGPGHVYDSVRRTCSGDICRRSLGRCVHSWEHDFRFGDLRSDDFVPPASQIRIRNRTSEKYSGVERIRKRPNPVIDGVRFATVMRRAREAVPLRTKELARDLAHWHRISSQSQREPRRPGRPQVDLADIAIAAAFRVTEGWSYEALDSMIPEWHSRGYLTTTFDYNRVVGAMTGSERTDLGELLDRMTVRVEKYFRNVARYFIVDGVIFSTRSSDNPRTGRSKGLQILCHAMYEKRWGLLTGFRLTWHARGRGSGEAPQLPYLLNMTRRVFTPELVLADGAYSSERNFKLADDHKFILLSPINSSKFSTRTKKILGEERAREILAECDSQNPGPLMGLAMPFRSLGEGWHHVVREQTEHYLVSRPDRKNTPPTTKEQKENPEVAETQLPEDQSERDLVIETEQNVGQAARNEFLARRLAISLRALTKAEIYYNERVDFFATHRAFEPRPEDDDFSPFSPPTWRAA